MSSLNWKDPKHVDGNQELDRPKQEKASPPSPSRTMEDLPPELLTKILEFVTLDTADQNALLDYRLVNLQWRETMDSLIENRIVLGEFPNSPEMNVESARGQLQVCLPITRLSADGNPFPFNSLHFNKKDRQFVSENALARSNYPIMSLPAFATRFGGNLTSLSLRDLLRFPIGLMSTKLSSMPSLKRLSLEDVTNDYETIFETPPPLPCLTILELVLTVKTRKMNDDIQNLYVWLCASYANLLVRLHLESYGTVPYPPLQTCRQYTYSDYLRKTRLIATTSESAFRNLKELKIFRPSRNFVLLSETPALQHFSVVHVDSYSRENFELEDLTIFIDKCGSTLESLVLSYPWNPMVSWEVSNKFMNGQRPPLILPTQQIVLPRLKTLAVYYPNTDVNEMVLSEFLIKFPALENFQLLFFKFNWFDFGIEDLLQHQIVNNEAVEVGNDNIQLVDEIVALKERLPPLLEHLSEIWKNKAVAEDVLHRLRYHPEVDVEEQADERQLEAEIRRLKRAEAGARKQRAAIFIRLVALGENTDKVMVEQLLERGGFWNTCPKLRIISVSKFTKPVEVCVIKRTDEA